MRRQNIELNDIAAWDNLVLATWKAARGKRLRPDVAEFLSDLEGSLKRLAVSILDGSAPHGRYRPFRIVDPKPRLIHAACFPDRVLHHAILNRAEPVFERALVDASFACRPGKGVHRAVARVQQNLRRFPWYVQVDVDGYFPSIDHRLLCRDLARHFKGADFLALLARIVDSYHAAPGFGLPIGSLTSQHFANLYLDPADRFLANDTSVRGPVRYMDDIIWWCGDGDAARASLRAFREFLEADRRLRLKPDIRINRSAHGARFCGYRILPGQIRLSERKCRRYRDLRNRLEFAWSVGGLSDGQLQSAFDAVLAITFHADSRAWRQGNLRIYPCRYNSGPG